MDDEKKYILYDNIIATTIHNFWNEAEIGPNKLVLRDFNKDNDIHMYMYKIGIMSSILQPTSNITIVLDMKWFDYIKFYFKHWKDRKHIERKRGNDNLHYTIINIEDMTEFLANHFGVKTEVFADIYNEYYK